VSILISCDRCSSLADPGVSPATVAQIRKMMHDRGWRYWFKRDYCPDCVTSARSTRRFVPLPSRLREAA
jgi:hypothetical protein